MVALTLTPEEMLISWPMCPCVFLNTMMDQSKQDCQSQIYLSGFAYITSESVGFYSQTS